MFEPPGKPQQYENILDKMSASPPLTSVELDPTKNAKEKTKKARGGKKVKGQVYVLTQPTKDDTPPKAESESL